MHSEAYEFVRRAVAGLDTNGLHVLEIGSHDVNGSVRRLFPGAKYVGIDRLPGLGVDVVADAKAYNGDHAFDVVVSTEALEHEAAPQRIIDCAARALKPGGLVIITTAGPRRKPHGADGGPVGPNEHYGAITPGALWAMLDGWEAVQVEEYTPHGDVYATAMRGLL